MCLLLRFCKHFYHTIDRHIGRDVRLLESKVACPGISQVCLNPSVIVVLASCFLQLKDHGISYPGLRIKAVSFSSSALIRFVNQWTAAFEVPYAAFGMGGGALSE